MLKLRIGPVSVSQAPSGSGQKECWRCGAPFVCGAGDAGEDCWCKSAPPAPIQNADADCLCPTCLTDVAPAGRDVLSQPMPSPCIKLCRIDPESGLCSGCLRTLDEIAAWTAFSDQERQAVFDALPSRKI